MQIDRSQLHLRTYQVIGNDPANAVKDLDVMWPLNYLPKSWRAPLESPCKKASDSKKYI